MVNTDSARSILQKHPIFLLTIPFVFLIHSINQYFSLLHWEYIRTGLLVYISVPLVIYFLLGYLWRSHAKAGVLMFFLLVIFYFFHLLFDWLRSITILSFLARYIVLLPLLLTGIIALIIYLQKSKSQFSSFYYRSNLVFLFLLAGGMIQYILLTFQSTATRLDQADPSKTFSKNYKPCDTCASPDIYFMIFDGYTNSKTLQTEFDYTNSFIENKLRSRGFFIADHSKSNYNFTHMSIGSELNLAYLANLDNTHRFYTKDILRSNYTIFHNELCDILKKQGYEINNYSGFALKDAPVKITPHLTELTWRSVLGQTFFNKLKRDIGWHLDPYFPHDKISAEKNELINDGVKRINEVFNGVIEVAKKSTSDPQFLYAHFIIPHETYYYDSSGKRLDLLYTANTLINKKDYVNQVAYTNRFLIAPLVDSIFNYARRPFIIIIQSDHGYRNYPAEKVSLEFENFSALYFPDRDYRTVSDSLSSVNTFRIILNKYFRQEIPLLKDTMIYLNKRNSY